MKVCFTLPSRSTSLKRGLSIVCFLILSSSALAEAPLLDDTVFAGWQKYEQFASTLQGTERLSNKSSGKSANVTWEVKQNLECAMRRELRDNKDFYTIELWNPNYHAALTRQVSDPEKVELLRLDKPTADWTMSLPAMDHFRYEEFKLRDLVSSPSFQIIKSSWETREGREMARIEYSSVREKQGGVENRGRGVMYLDPSRYWCLVQVIEKAEQFRGGVLYYTGDSDTHYETNMHSSGFPLVQCLTRHSTGLIHKDNRKVEISTRSEYDWKVDAHVPNGEFTLTAFGLPEPMGVKPIPPSRTWLWLLAAAVSAASLAILFTWLKRRRVAAVQAKISAPSKRN